MKNFLELLRLIKKYGVKQVVERIETAIYDDLTRLPRRKTFIEAIKKEIERYNRSSIPFSICFIDLNDFGKINKEHGHQQGDEALIQFARFLQIETRKIDTPARWGGDEFAILLPETNSEEALMLLKRIYQKGQLLEVLVSFSFGVATYMPGEDISALIKRADDRMRSFKR